jgi:hypothetical protein
MTENKFPESKTNKDLNDKLWKYWVATYQHIAKLPDFNPNRKFIYKQIYGNDMELMKLADYTEDAIFNTDFSPEKRLDPLEIMRQIGIYRWLEENFSGQGPTRSGTGELYDRDYIDNYKKSLEERIKKFLGEESTPAPPAPPAPIPVLTITAGQTVLTIPPLK